MTSNFERLSQLQKDFVNADVSNKARQSHRNSWLREDTIDFWRHRRMYESIRPLAESFKQDRWLTVGDGRWGLDAHRLKALFNIDNILASDISDQTLIEGKEKGLIENFSVENMEHLSFPDRSFDVVFCKESFHHCPRPWLAFYELCRVARKAVILIEPPLNFHFKREAPSSLSWKERLKVLAGRPPAPHLPEVVFDPPAYENCGNYVYRLSSQELEQAVRGLSLPGYSWKGLADFYETGIEYEPANESNPKFVEFRDKVVCAQKLHDHHPSLYPTALATACVFLSPPESSLIEALSSIGHSMFFECENPYLNT